MNAAAALELKSAFLSGVVAAVERRGKAIRYHGRLEISRTVEEPYERLNLDLRMISDLKIRLSVWDDGAFWVGVSAGKPGPRKGWDFKESVDGWFDSGLDGDVVRERFEATIHDYTNIRSIWAGD